MNKVVSWKPVRDTNDKWDKSHNRFSFSQITIKYINVNNKT